MLKGGSRVNLLIPRKHNSCLFYNMQCSDSHDPSLTGSPFLCYCDLNLLWATWAHLFQHVFSTIVDWNPLKLWAKRNFYGLQLFPSGTVVTETREELGHHMPPQHIFKGRGSTAQHWYVTEKKMGQLGNLVKVGELLETKPGKTLTANSHYYRNAEATLTRHPFSRYQAATLPPFKP